jgi:hypothetical protein
MSFAREATSTHLKRRLARLGHMVSGDASRVRVEPAEGIGQRQQEDEGKQEESSKVREVVRVSH